MTNASALSEKKPPLVNTNHRIILETLPARSPASKGIKKLIHDTMTKAPDGRNICKKWLITFRSRLIQKPVTE